MDPSKADAVNDVSEDVPFTSQGHANHGSTLAAAVRALQAHERARQGRVHAYLMHQMKNESKTKETESSDDHSLGTACLIIQTIWRQKYAEKLFNDRKADEARLLNMVISHARVPAVMCRTLCRFDRLLQVLTPRTQSIASTSDRREKRQALQVQYEQELADAANDVREKIRQHEAVDVKARLEQVLVQWLLESRQLYGQFPIYPPPELNGSSALFKEMSIAEVQDFVNKVPLCDHDFS